MSGEILNTEQEAAAAIAPGEAAGVGPMPAGVGPMPASVGPSPSGVGPFPVERAEPRRENRRATSDVSFPLALGLALPLYGVSVLAAHAMPPGVEAILLDRGWVCHAILLLSCLALTILLLKARSLRAQRLAFEVELVPHDLRSITPDNVGDVLAHVSAHRQARERRGAPRSFLIERVLRLLEHYAARGDVPETAALNGSESELDAASVAGSFSVVKVLVWAIPILGFIGTVIGIGDAVGGFSRSLEGAGQLDAIKTSLGDVTSGLAVAFDSTLVALVASIFVMVPTSGLQKAEDQLVNDVDDHVVTGVLRRLASPVAADVALPSKEAAADEAAVARALVVEAVAPQLREMLDAHTALLARLSGDHASLTAAQAAVSAQISAFAGAAGQLVSGIERAAGHLDRGSEELERATGQLGHAMGQMERATGQLERATGQLEQATSLAGQTAGAAARAEDQLCRELGASRQLLALLAAGLGAPGADAPSPGRKHANGSNGAHAG